MQKRKFVTPACRARCTAEQLAAAEEAPSREEAAKASVIQDIVEPNENDIIETVDKEEMSKDTM